MADLSTSLSLYMPKCALCFSDALTASHYLVQLSCYHLFCNHCVKDIETAGEYVCPMDELHSETFVRNRQLFDVSLWLTSYWSTLDATQIRGQVEWLKKSVNYYMVFCRFQECVGAEAAIPCPYSHMNSLERVVCPKGEGCWRRATCPYNHTAPSSDWYLTTLQVQSSMQKGHIVIRSLSAFNELADGGYAKLHAIFKKVLGNVPKYNLKTHDVDFRSGISWFFLPQSGQPQEFPAAVSRQIEQTYRLKGNFMTLDAYSSVYFNPMLRLYQNGSYEAVARLERVNSTSDAAILEVTSDAQFFSPLYQAIKASEEEMPIGRLVDGEAIKRLCVLYGLSTRNDKFIGTRASLAEAQLELASEPATPFPALMCIDRPVTFPLQLLTDLCTCFGLILSEQRIYGVNADVQSFFTYLTSGYGSLPVPLGMSQQEKQAACQQYGLIADEAYLAGPIEAVTAMTNALTEKMPIPADIDPARLISLPTHVPVKVQDGLIQGSKADVQQALQVLHRKDTKVSFPSNLPKVTVQAVAQKYGLKLSNTQLIGDSERILKALNELNQMPQGQAFQYHQPADWFLSQPEEMNIQTLSTASQEYQDVAARFNETMGEISVLVTIERLQNKRLYTSFAYKHEAYSIVEGKAVEIRELFHGTSGTDPTVIFQSDTGLDSRLGKGLWGQGTYYAQNADYSHGYCFRTAANQCQMFLCQVIVGEYVELPQDEDLRRPPQRPGSSACFHSVKGITDSSEIFITYEAAMSYPMWLITYECQVEAPRLVFLIFIGPGDDSDEEEGENDSGSEDDSDSEDEA